MTYRMICAAGCVALAVGGLAGCVPAAFLAGGAAVGATANAVTQERSTSQQLTDTKTSYLIEQRLVSRSGDLFRRVGVDVFEGRAMLTGTVLSPQAQQDAAQIAATTAGVTEVLNEIVVNPAGGGVATYAGDVQLANAARARLFTSGLIKQQNYDLRVNHGIIYIIGVAISEEELARVTQTAAQTPGAKQVVSHALLYTDPRRGQAAS